MNKKKLRKMHQEWAGAEVVSSKIIGDDFAVVLDDDPDWYAPITIYRDVTLSPAVRSLTIKEAEELVHTLNKMVKKAKKSRDSY